MASRRSDPGLAVAFDWSSRKRDILAERNKNWESLSGNQVYLDLVVGSKTEQTMRLVFALFMDEVPLAAANFYAFCTQRYDGVGEAGHPLTYRRSKIVRLVRSQFLQGGDTTHNQGGGGDSIYGSTGFEDEPLGLRMLHNASGLLSMANHGPDTNRSQFLITLGPAPSLDGKHVIFGRLVSGALHLPTLDALPVDDHDAPAVPVTIVECGAIPGWHRPLLPLPEAKEQKVTLPALDKEASEQRDAVAGAVQEALRKRSADEAADAEVGRKKSARSAASAMMGFQLPGMGNDDTDSGEEDSDASIAGGDA